MLKNADASIYNFYGVHTCFNDIICKNTYFIDFLSLDLSALASDVLQYTGTGTAFLFLSFPVSNIQDRHLEFSQLLFEKYSLKCVTFTDKVETICGSLSRIGVVVCDYTQFRRVFPILYEFPNNAFIIWVDEFKQNMLIPLLFSYFSKGTLTISVLRKICSCLFEHNYPFLHILQGYDGFSINLIFHKAWHGTD